jgi:hypothetical protein
MAVRSESCGGGRATETDDDEAVIFPSIVTHEHNY